jgi:DNA-directed RNA polymerase specialized sigma subunit
MTRAIVDEKLNELLSAEAQLKRTLRTSPKFDEICVTYRKAEAEYNEAFEAWWQKGD